MASSQMGRRHRFGVLLGGAAGLVATGCTLLYAPPVGQHLTLTFGLSEALARGEERVVASWTVEPAVDTRGRTLQLSGAITRPPGARLPREVRLVATVSEPDGRVRQRLRLTADVRPEDRFRVAKRVRRDLAAGSRIEVAVEPRGDDLPAGAEITLCVDLVAARGDLRRFASCAAGAGATTFDAIQERVLTPRCALAGCHDTATSSAGLDLEAGRAYDSLVEVPSSQVFLRQRVAPRKPDDSYLVQKIRGSSAINGGRMPLGGPFLSADEISGIVEWIENGAARN